MTRALSIYKNFHGHAPRRAILSTFRPPATLVCLGRAVEIVYSSNKRNGGGTGKLEQFIHKFRPGDYLYTDESGRKLYVLGSSLRITARGIIN